MYKNCVNKGCKSRCVYGYEKNKPIFCHKHRFRDMKNVVKNVCETTECDNSAYYRLDKLRYCEEHKSSNAYYQERKLGRKREYVKHPIDTIRKNEPIYYINHIPIGQLKCTDIGCETRPSFGIVFGKPLYCKTHKPENAINTLRIKCIVDNCMRYLTRRYASNGGVYCPKHRLTNIEEKSITYIEH